MPCIGDGTSGNRVQMVYARSALAPDRYDELLPDFRAWAAEADQAVWLNPAETGGGRHLRFVTDGCQLDVAQAVLTPPGEASFDQMRTELQLLGFNRADRKYMVWADAAVGTCGLGEVYDDQRAHQHQLEQQRAHVRARGRALLALRRAARGLPHPGRGPVRQPHHSASRHCTDEADVMCYDDDAGGPVTMDVVCPPEREALLDCGHDDYLTSPPARRAAAT